MKKEMPDVFAALGDPTRRRILFLLTAGAMNVQLLASNFEVSRPAISKHIRTLREAGLISIDDRGRERCCTLNRAGFDEIKEWLEFYDQFWKNNLRRLEGLLHERTKSKNIKSKKDKQ